MNKQLIEKEVFGTNVNGEKEATPMGPFYKIKEGVDYTKDIINELEALNTGAIKAHEEAIGILTFYNTALSEKMELQDKEKYINDANGWIDIISKDNMESLAAEFYWNAANDGDLDYSMEFFEEVIRMLDMHFDLEEEEETINNIIDT